MRDKKRIATLKREANGAKSRLIRIEDALLEAGGKREANGLAAVIRKLEEWQNR